MRKIEKNCMYCTNYAQCYNYSHFEYLKKLRAQNCEDYQIDYNLYKKYCENHLTNN